MTPYKTIYEHYRACSATWAANDLDQHIALEESEPQLSANETAEFIEDFCSRAGRHAQEDGVDVVGDMIWYLMGSGYQVWVDVREADHEYARDAILGVQNLYERCFAVHLTDWKGVGSGTSRLATACYMLWDMDGGLEAIPMFREPKALVSACYELLERALALDSPACWESALHGLGHIILSHGDPGRGMIDAFLAAKDRMVPDDLRRYAMAAHAGDVQ